MMWLSEIFAQLRRGEVNLPDATVDQNTVNRALTTARIVFGAIALILMAYAGFKYVMSQGNPQETQKAQNTILYTVIGLVIAIFVTTLITFVINRL